uniref:Major facilitator superfamily (MFS) profile domain-containing protein n=1 Tax=Phaeomonas parva TaxID=124430 RepID=A0A7S1U2V0_9STRA|mmetsp:Transcript_29086/g.93053  ORF Transcript_29086/g.93053 Transcript_29086/m.93053 type:complete len:575 (+) Transcript_29086:229-1953(+)
MHSASSGAEGSAASVSGSDARGSGDNSIPWLHHQSGDEDVILCGPSIYGSGWLEEAFIEGRAGHDGSASKSGQNARDEEDLPALQVACACLITFAEAFQLGMRLTFLPFFLKDLGYEGKRNSLAVGLVLAVLFVGMTIGAMPWGAFSDRYGRRPTLLVSNAGAITALLVFGSATSLAQVAIGEFFGGLLNTSSSVLNAWVNEFCGEQRKAKGFSFLMVAYGVGVIIGPALGGFLADPAEQHPEWAALQAPLWRRFPYLLPCVVAAALLAVVWFVTLVFAEETLPEPKALPWPCRRKRKSSALVLAEDADGSEPLADEPGGAGAAAPLVDLSLLKDERIGKAIGLYVIISLWFLVLEESVLFLFVGPREDGGGGLSNVSLGLVTGGASVVLFAAPFFLPPLERRYGRVGVVGKGFLVLAPMSLVFPVVASVLSAFSAEVAVAMGVFTLLAAAKNLAASAILAAVFMLINDSVDNDSSRLGLVNGTAQLVVGFFRTVGSLFAGALWSAGLHISFAPDFLAFVVLACSAIAASVYVAFMERGARRAGGYAHLRAFDDETKEGPSERSFEDEAKEGLV